MNYFKNFFALMIMAFVMVVSGCDTSLMGVDDYEEMTLEEVKARILMRAAPPEEVGQMIAAGKGAGSSSTTLVLIHGVGVTTAGQKVYTFEIRWDGIKTSFGMYAAPHGVAPEVFQEGFKLDGFFGPFLRKVGFQANTQQWVNVSVTLLDVVAGHVTFSFAGEGGVSVVLPNVGGMQYRASMGTFVSFGTIPQGDVVVEASFTANLNAFTHRAVLPYSTLVERFGLTVDETVVVSADLTQSGNGVGRIDEYTTAYLDQVLGSGTTIGSFNYVRVRVVRIKGGQSRPPQEGWFCDFQGAVDPNGVTTLFILPTGCKG